MVFLNKTEPTSYKTFTSDQKWFSIHIPSTWERYDDKEGTYAFFDATGWTGNLRLTPFRITAGDMNPDEVIKVSAGKQGAKKESLTRRKKKLGKT